MRSRETDGKLQVIAALRLFEFSGLLKPDTRSSRLIALSNDLFESNCQRVDPVCGRLICWISFSAGAEFLAKGVCLLLGIEVRTEKRGETDFGTLGHLNGKNGNGGALGRLCDQVQAMDEERLLLIGAYKELAVIRNRDAHAYVANVRHGHFEAVRNTFVPAFNLLTSWLPYDPEDVHLWNENAAQFVALLP